jgi:hypothetical protein
VDTQLSRSAGRQHERQQGAGQGREEGWVPLENQGELYTRSVWLCIGVFQVDRRGNEFTAHPMMQKKCDQWKLDIVELVGGIGKCTETPGAGSLLC